MNERGRMQVRNEIFKEREREREREREIEKWKRRMWGGGEKLDKHIIIFIER